MNCVVVWELWNGHQSSHVTQLRIEYTGAVCHVMSRGCGYGLDIVAQKPSRKTDHRRSGQAQHGHAQPMAIRTRASGARCRQVPQSRWTHAQSGRGGYRHTPGIASQQVTMGFPPIMKCAYAKGQSPPGSHQNFLDGSALDWHRTLVSWVAIATATNSV